MATVSPNSRGQFSVQWVEGKKRPTLYLGQVPKDYAEEVRRRVSRIVQCRELGEPLDSLTALWLRECPPKLRTKLAAKGLIAESGVRTIEQLCDYCIKQAHVEPSTLQKYRDTKVNLIDCMGAHRSIEAVTPGDCDEFRTWLAQRGKRPKPGPLASSTVSKRLQQARQFFTTALRKRWITANPFDGITAPAIVPPGRQFYVTREAAQALMDAANPEMRLMVALVRYGGLRCPSEIWPLRLDWIDQANDVLKVYSPKNKRFEHKAWRAVPLFPEIRGLLQDAFDAAPDGAALLFPNQGVTATAIRNRLQRLCLDAGLMPWKKLWQNMRSTRETELVDAGFPVHVVCQWLGNSPAIANRHYLQVVKEHVHRAVAPCRVSADSDQAAESSADFTARSANHS